MKKKRVFWGIFFIAGAVALLVSRMGLLGELNIWTILLTVLLIGGLFKSIVYRSISGVLFSLAFLAIVHGETLGITAITPWPVLGAALLGSIGLSIIFQPYKSFKKHGRGHHDAEFFGSTETVDGDQIHLETSFGSAIKYITSDDFKRASFNCSFGAMKVYFDNALIQQGSAEIYVDISFAGVELFIPKTWKVENRVDMSFAGVEEKNRSESTGTPVVYLTGEVSFSGVTIIYI